MFVVMSSIVLPKQYSGDFGRCVGEVVAMVAMAMAIAVVTVGAALVVLAVVAVLVVGVRKIYIDWPTQTKW